MITTTLLLIATHRFHKEIVLQTRVATVPALVKELADLSGKSLATSPEVHSEVLFVSLKESDPNRLMALIAKADSAEWVEKDGQFVLTRTGALRRKQERDDQRAMASLVQRQISKILLKEDQAEPSDSTAKEWVSEAQKPPKPGANYKTYIAFEETARNWSPADRMLSRALRAISAEDLAAIEIGHTARWSTLPTRLQNRLPVDENSLGQYVRERNLLAALLGTIAKDEIREDAAMHLRMRQKTTIPVHGVPLALLSVTKSLGQIELKLNVFGGDGTLLDIATSTIDLDAEPPVPLPGATQWGLNELATSPAWQSIINNILQKPMDQSQVRLAMDPLANDPLAVFFSDPIQALAKAVDKPTIFRIPDEATFASRVFLNTNSNLGEFARALQSSILFGSDGGVQLGTARYPSLSRSLKADRGLLKNLLGSLRDYKLPSLDLISKYAFKAGDGPLTSGMEDMLARATGLFQSYYRIQGITDSTFGGRDMLRFYANCMPQQQKAFWTGSAIPFGQLPLPSQQELRSAVLTRSASLNFDVLTASGNMDPTSYIDDFGPATMITGIPKLEPCVTTKLTSGTDGYFEASSIGYILSQQERGEWLDEISGYPIVKKSKFVPVMQGNLRLSVRILPRATVSTELADYQIDPKAAPVTYDSLPASHLAPLQKTLAYYRKMFQENDTTSGQKPPP